MTGFMTEVEANPLAFWQRQVGDHVTGFKGNHWRSKSMSSLAEEEDEKEEINNNNNKRRDNNVLVEVIVVEEKSLEHVPAFQTSFFDEEPPEEERQPPSPSPRDLPSKIPLRVRSNSQCDSPEEEEAPFSPPEHRPSIKPHVAPDWCISTKFKPTPAALIPSPPKKRPLLRSQSEFTGMAPWMGEAVRVGGPLSGTSKGHRRASTAPKATDYSSTEKRRPSMPLRATVNFQSSSANYTPAPLVERSPRGSEADKNDGSTTRPKRVYSRSNSLDRPASGASGRRESQNLPANFQKMNVNGGAAAKTSPPANFRRMNTEQTPSAADRRQRLQRASSVEAVDGGSSPRRSSLQKMVYVGAASTNGERQVSNDDRGQLRRISNGDGQDSNVPTSTTNIPNVRMRAKKSTSAKDETRRRSNAF